MKNILDDVKYYASRSRQISIPQMQVDLELTYRQASYLVNELVEQKYIEYAGGIMFSVCKREEHSPVEKYRAQRPRRFDYLGSGHHGKTDCMMRDLSAGPRKVLHESDYMEALEFFIRENRISINDFMRNFCVSYYSVHRILRKLREAGYVECGQAPGEYRLTSAALRLPEIEDTSENPDDDDDLENVFDNDDEEDDDEISEPRTTEDDENNQSSPVIKVIGFGRAGTSIVEELIKKRENVAPNVEYIVVDRDESALCASACKNKILLGTSAQRLIPAVDVEVGKMLASASKAELVKALRGADLAVIVTGLGGGTGTGSALYATEVANEMNVRTVAAVSMPFGFEGEVRQKRATAAALKLRLASDNIILIPNSRSTEISDNNIRLFDQCREKWIGGIENLIRPLCSDGENEGFGIEEFTSAIRKKNILRAGRAVGEDGEELESLVKTAFEDCLTAEDKGEFAGAVVLVETTEVLEDEQKKKIKDAINKVTGVSPLTAFAAGKIKKGTVISVLVARKY